jgi:predicted metalloprotease with PDZ domain
MPLLNFISLRKPGTRGVAALISTMKTRLNWLWVDVLIRQQSKGTKTIDDFCHLFHGAPSTGPMVKTYTFDDVINALNQVVPYDWRGFWIERLTNHGPGAPLGGIEGSGWKLVYDESQSEMLRGVESNYHVVGGAFSIGLELREDGTITDTTEGMPAALAGIGPGMKLIAVNGRQYSPEVLRDALKAGKGRYRSARTPGREHRLLQNLQARLPRRRALPAPGTRRIEA